MVKKQCLLMIYRYTWCWQHKCMCILGIHIEQAVKYSDGKDRSINQNLLSITANGARNMDNNMESMYNERPRCCRCHRRTTILSSFKSITICKQHGACFVYTNYANSSVCYMSKLVLSSFFCDLFPII